MNTPWIKILVFSLLFGAIGFFLGRHCCHGGGCGGHRSHCEAGMGGCEKGGASCHGKSQCDHGGACCSGEGKCGMAECDHKMGGACCKGGKEGHGHGGAHNAGVHAIVEKLETGNFQGDTTIAIEGGTVQVSRHGDKTEVKVEMRDSVKVVEKVVEVH